MAKKSKSGKSKSKSVKQIPAKVGAKAKVGSGGKVEVVLKTTKVVKDASRGNYKPRKKKKKEKVSKQEKSALELLREQIELEKLQKLQQERFNPLPSSSRIPNRRTSGDVNQFFGKTKNDGTKEIVGELSKQIKELREEVKKKNETPKEDEKEKEKEDKSKFEEELKTTQNEIQRQRIQRGIARRDEEQREKNLQRQLDDVEKQQKIEQSRLRVATKTLRQERSANQQARAKNIEQFEEREKERRTEKLRKEKEQKQQDELRRAIQKEDERRAKIKQRNDELKRKLVQEKTQERLQKVDRKIAQDKVQSILKEANTNLRERKRKEKQDEEDKRKSKPLFLDNEESVKKIFPEDKRKSKPEPQPEPEPTPVEKRNFVVGGDGGTEVPFKSQEELLQAFRNRPNQPKPLPKKEDDIEELFQELEQARKTKPSKPLFLDDEESVKKIFPEDDDFDTADEEDDDFESINDKDKAPALKIGERKKVSIDLEPTQTTIEEVEATDKILANRLQAQVDIAENERVARDLLLQEARKKDLSIANENLDQTMRDLKDQKQREKKKARDNLRKRQQEEFIDETAGELVSEAIGGAVSEADRSNQFRNKLREKQRQKASSKLVRNVFENVVGGRSLAQEVISANQNIPRNVREQNRQRDEDLLHSDRTGKVERKAYTPEEVEEKRQLEKDTANLKKNLILSFPEIISNRYGKDEFKKMDNRIKEDVAKAKATGKYSGIQLVQLETILRRIRDNYVAIKNIELSKRGRGKFQTETPEERQLRIRQEQRGLFNPPDDEDTAKKEDDIDDDDTERPQQNFDDDVDEFL
jgi:hypothetical protein